MPGRYRPRHLTPRGSCRDCGFADHREKAAPATGAAAFRICGCRTVGRATGPPVAGDARGSPDWPLSASRQKASGLPGQARLRQSVAGRSAPLVVTGTFNQSATTTGKTGAPPRRLAPLRAGSPGMGKPKVPVASQPKPWHRAASLRVVRPNKVHPSGLPATGSSITGSPPRVRAGLAPGRSRTGTADWWRQPR